MVILVINGPNMNMLGRRQKEIYGRKTYEDLVRFVEQRAEEKGHRAVCYQSNHEGDLVDRIQEAEGSFDGIIINPAAYTHTSVAILDALLGTEIPAVEVHISDTSRREDFRKISFVREACLDKVEGLGFEGYAKAMDILAEHVGK